MIIYLATNNKNGKLYVGKLYHKKSLESYWGSNVAKALKGYEHKPYLYSAIRKHGPEAFSVKEIEKCNTHEELCAAETKWILLYRSNDPEFGYNLTTGGEGNPGHRVSTDARKRIGDSHRGKPLLEAHCKKLSDAKKKNPVNYWLGKKRPNAFGSFMKDGGSSVRGKKVIYLDGKKKYISKEEYDASR